MCLVGHTVDIVKETWAGAFACTDHLNFFWWTPRASMAFENHSDQSNTTSDIQLDLRISRIQVPRLYFLRNQYCAHTPRPPPNLHRSARPEWRQ